MLDHADAVHAVECSWTKWRFVNACLDQVDILAACQIGPSRVNRIANVETDNFCAQGRGHVKESTGTATNVENPLPRQQFAGPASLRQKSIGGKMGAIHRIDL